MKFRKLVLIAAAMVGLSNMAGAAFAQTKIFVINEEKIRRDSKVGKEIAAAMGGIRNQGVEKLGLKSLGDEIKTETDALKPQTQSLTKEALDANPTLKSRVDALNKKTNEYLQKADYLNQNLEQSNNGLNQAFLRVMEPAASYVAKQAGADLVLSYSSTWYVKDAIDLSAKVTARLDATVPTMAAMETALKPPGAPAAAAGAPAASAAPPAAPPAVAPPPKPQGGQ